MTRASACQLFETLERPCQLDGTGNHSLQGPGQGINLPGLTSSMINRGKERVSDVGGCKRQAGMGCQMGVLWFEYQEI